MVNREASGLTGLWLGKSSIGFSSMVPCSYLLSINGTGWNIFLPWVVIGMPIPGQVRYSCPCLFDTSCDEAFSYWELWSGYECGEKVPWCSFQAPWSRAAMSGQRNWWIGRWPLTALACWRDRGEPTIRTAECRLPQQEDRTIATIPEMGRRTVSVLQRDCQPGHRE